MKPVSVFLLSVRSCLYFSLYFSLCFSLYLTDWPTAPPLFTVATGLNFVVVEAADRFEVGRFVHFGISRSKFPSDRPITSLCLRGCLNTDRQTDTQTGSFTLLMIRRNVSAVTSSWHLTTGLFPLLYQCGRNIIGQSRGKNYSTYSLSASVASSVTVC